VKINPLLLLSLAVVAVGCCRPGRKQKLPSRIHEGPFVAVAANMRHTCALQLAGTPVCFGGDDTVNPPMTPAPGIALRTIATGGRFACGLTRDDASMVCWGDCAHGRCRVPPGAFAGFTLSDDGGGCAWREPAGALCWGDSPEARGAPSLASEALRDVALGAGWGVALRKDGTLLGWGGQQVARDPRLQKAIRDRETFQAIAGKGAVLCLVGMAGEVSCIMHHQNQVPPAISGRPLRIAMANPRGVFPACILFEPAGAPGSSDVRCSRTNKNLTLPAVRDAVDIAVGADHLCALQRDGRLFCAGDDLFGQVSGSRRWP